MSLEDELSNLKISEEKYIEHVFIDKKFRQRIKDGYFSSTDICKIFNKQSSNFLHLSGTKKFVKQLSIELKIKEDELIQVKKGGADFYNQGTWMHPLITTYFSMWVSVKFSIKVTQWVEEWKNINDDNNNKYLKEISILEPSLNDQKEKEIQNKLKIELNAETEIKTLAGYIDLLSDDYIIEIKEFSKWKHALGQILSYAKFYPLKVKKIYLFDYENKNTDEIDLIKQIYADYNISLILID
jgi:hypothetical protein